MKLESLHFYIRRFLFIIPETMLLEILITFRNRTDVRDFKKTYSFLDPQSIGYILVLSVSILKDIAKIWIKSQPIVSYHESSSIFTVESVYFVDSVHVRNTVKFLKTFVSFKVIESFERIISHFWVIVKDVSSNQMHFYCSTVLIKDWKMMQSHNYFQRTDVERSKKRAIWIVDLCIEPFPYLKF